MPGIALARKPRISASKDTRSGVAMLPPRRRTRIEQLQQSGDADGGGDRKRGMRRILRERSETIITAISAMLNNSGENAVSANRPCAFNSAIITATGPAKAR